MPALPVHECSGFVYALAGSENDEPVAPNVEEYTVHPETIGTAVSGLSVEQYFAALLDGPHALLEFPGLVISDFTIADPEIRDNALIVDRAAVWRKRAKRDLRFHSEFDLTLRVTAPVNRDLVTISVLNSAERALASLRLSATEGRRGTTNICWRANVSPAFRATAPLMTRIHPAFRRKPVDVFSQFDAAAIAALLPGPSNNLPEPNSKFDQHMQAAQ